MKLLEHCVKVIENINKKKFKIVTANEKQFASMPGKEAAAAVFISKRRQEKHCAKIKKLYVCLGDLQKGIDRVARKFVECEKHKKYQKYWLDK